MGNCLQLHREKRQERLKKKQSVVLRNAQTSMDEIAQYYRNDKERVNREITEFGKQIAVQLQLYKTGKITRETAQRTLKDLKFKERLTISKLEKIQTNELLFRQRSEQLSTTEMDLQNSHELNKVVLELGKVNIKVADMARIAEQMDTHIELMREATSQALEQSEETTKSVENTGQFEKEAALSVDDMLDKADAQALDLDALPKPRTRAPQHLHRILGPNALRSEEEEEKEDEGGGGGGFVSDDLNAGEDHTVFSNMD